MRYTTGLVAVVISAACGGTQQQPERLSVQQNLAEAEQHDRQATQHEQAYARARQAQGGPIQCYDQRLPDPTIGGEPVRVLRPCWTREEPASRHHLDEARTQRDEAARHRAVAASELGGMVAVTISARRDWEIAAVVGRAKALLAPVSR